MLTDATFEYLMIEFSEKTAATKLDFVMAHFLEKGAESWTGSVVVLEFDRARKEITVADLFCERPDEVLSWADFVAVITQARGLHAH